MGPRVVYIMHENICHIYIVNFLSIGISIKREDENFEILYNFGRCLFTRNIFIVRLISIEMTMALYTKIVGAKVTATLDINILYIYI